MANISEGRDTTFLATLAAACGSALLDVHTDPDHHRSVFTMVEVSGARALASAAVGLLDLRDPSGVHPRIGVVDVVPFVPLAGSTMASAVAARDSFAEWIWSSLGVPAFLYGPERSLPEVRRLAGSDLGQFDDVYVAGADGVKRFRASGVALGLSQEGVTGRAFLKNSSGHYDDVYVKTPEGSWRFKSRVHVVDAP